MRPHLHGMGTHQRGSEWDTMGPHQHGLQWDPMGPSTSFLSKSAWPVAVRLWQPVASFLGRAVGGPAWHGDAKYAALYPNAHKGFPPLESAYRAYGLRPSMPPQRRGMACM